MSGLSRGVALLVMVFFLVSVGLVQAQVQPAKEGEDKYWKVPGYRHGPSAFLRNFLVETTPLREGVMDFKHYHTNEEMVWWYKKWAEEYPDLVEVYVAAQSFGGIDIYQVTLTNKKTGPATDKPAMFLDGNRHSSEVTAAESAFWMLHHMLTNYGKDAEITRLLDNFAFYFRPKNNPDGSGLYLQTAQSLRSTIRPYDNDRDGLLDEDPAEDLDGDGLSRQMRVNVGMGNGTHIVDPRDSKGRIMKSVGQGNGDYLMMSEGIDNDKDGRINEDGVGGLDLHRNYAENWRPMSEATGRGFTQGGAGAFPLSEVETRSLVVFLLANPNISIMNTMDTTVPMHLRPPSTSRSEERMYPEDLKLYQHFDEEGLKLSGYGRAGDVYQDYGGGNPLFGHSPDFGYWYYGAIWYGDELWNGGRVPDVDGDGRTDDWDKILYQEEHLEKVRFQNWTKIIHPVHGEAEVGGWDSKFWRTNPPPELMEEWAIKEAKFNLMLAGSLPQVEINEPRIAKRGDEYRIVVEVENKGYLPTALKQAQLVKIVRPDTLTLELAGGASNQGARGVGRGGRGAGMRGQRGGRGNAQVQTIQPGGRSTINIDRIEGNDSKRVTFRVNLNDAESLKATIRYSSTRGGVKTKEFTIGG